MSTDLFFNLRCPTCKGPLINHENCLECPRHGKFSIVNDIPSFEGMHEFDRHWEESAEVQLPVAKLAEASRFLAAISPYAQSRTLGSVLDAGCGDGVHIVALNQGEILPPDTRKFAVDISMAALLKAKHRSGNDWTLIHGDVANLPFETGFFDLVFSYGVLAYTKSPLHSFIELCRVTKPGGLIGIWVYAKPHGLSGSLLMTVRSLGQKGGPLITRLLADFIVPFLFFLPTSSGVTLANATWQQCREVVLVNLAPKQLVYLEEDEVAGWYEKQNVEIIQRDCKIPIALWGIKR